MGEAHLGHVGHEPVGELVVGQVAIALLGHAHPGPEVALVDRDRRVAGAGRGARADPAVVPHAGSPEAVHDRGGARRRSAANATGSALSGNSSLLAPLISYL